MKILLATQGSQGVVALRELFAENFKPENIHVAVCSKGENGPLLEFIRYNQMAFSSHSSGKDFEHWLLNVETEYQILLSISWAYLFSQSVIDQFPGRAVNFHSGLLPDYRGCFSIPWSIINEEKYVGFTYHYITKNFDEGNIILLEKFLIDQVDTAHSLNYRVFQRGLSKLADVIRLIGKEGKRQAGEGKYYPNRLPFDGRVNEKWTNKRKNLFSRAMYFPPHEKSLKLLPESILPNTKSE